jgi:hypothetical protein
MKRTSERRVCQNFQIMKTNHWWVEIDYKLQTVAGYGFIAFILGSILLTFFSKMGYAGLYLSLVLLIPIGAWQVLSGLIYAFKGDRLQQIYLGVVALYFSFWFIIPNAVRDYFPITFLIAFVIAVWKYTVVRADYISLKIIDVPKMGDDNLLDA